MDYKQKWETAMTYADYRKLIKELIDRNMSTGPNQSDALLEYSKLNDHRMNRLDKTFTPDQSMVNALKGKLSEIKSLVITEGWCGDASQIVPVLSKFTEALGIQSRFILRDEHLDAMDLHLTNGARAIPMVLFLNEHYKPVYVWGPRPAELQKQVLEDKASGVPYEDLKKRAQMWYNNDHQQSMQKEWSEALQMLIA